MTRLLAILLLAASQAFAADAPPAPTLEQYSIAYGVVVKQRDAAQNAVNQQGVEMALKIAELEAQIAALKKQLAETKPKDTPPK